MTKLTEKAKDIGGYYAGVEHSISILNLKKKPKWKADKYGAYYQVKSVRSKPIQHEEKMCMDFIKLLTLDRSLRKYKKFVMHVPNGGKRSAATGAKMKAMGTMKGAADYIVMNEPIYRIINKDGINILDRTVLDWEGATQLLFLEFKYGKNRQSPEQKEFEKMVTLCGHLYTVVYTIEDAILEIKKFWGDE